MRKIKWRKWLRILHRDAGYLFFAATVVYSVSGIAINHLNDWDPNYAITTRDFKVNLPPDFSNPDEGAVLAVLKQVGEEKNYKKHYVRNQGSLKVFLKGNANIIINRSTGEGYLERVERRAVLHAFNYLHYNPGRWWTVFSDIFSFALFFMAASGLFMIKGKKGITGRGAWMTALGIIVPILYLVLYYS
ncbi:MAG: PepSY-associated TM helix domain-containing protein [Saprospiraceae bacterium]|nr:PepSY-associated TM helix domain-containing protein [Saprospiraceae bacterium]MCB9326534.1 PepSY-associated TM helix domain-containing protein [Lewinellaceae bacterium]